MLREIFQSDLIIFICGICVWLHKELLFFNKVLKGWASSFYSELVLL